MSDIRIFAFADEASSMMDGQIAAMQRNGLQGLEIRDVEGTNVSEITVQKAKEVRKKLDDAGLVTWSIGSPIGKTPIDGDFAAHLEKLKHTLEVADILGAENIRLFSFYMPKDISPDLYADQVVDKLGAIVEVCVGSGIVPCHENEKGIFGDNAKRCDFLLRHLPRLQGIFDPANFVQCKQDTLTAWKLLQPRIKYLHIKDALWDGNVVPSGKGEGHVKEIIRCYLEAGGREMTLEPHLFEFKALKGLEQSGNTSEVGAMAFESANTAFDVGAAALKNILEELQ